MDGGSLMAHRLPIKIECRQCLGDGTTRFGFSKPVKVECSMCEGRRHLWIDEAELRPSDVILKR